MVLVPVHARRVKGDDLHSTRIDSAICASSRYLPPRTLPVRAVIEHVQALKSVHACNQHSQSEQMIERRCNAAFASDCCWWTGWTHAQLPAHVLPLANATSYADSALR